jgi:hypothetical protein
MSGRELLKISIIQELMCGMKCVPKKVPKSSQKMELALILANRDATDLRDRDTPDLRALYTLMNNVIDPILSIPKVNTNLISLLLHLQVYFFLLKVLQDR